MALVGHLTGLAILIAGLWLGWHVLLEDDSPVWVAESPVRAEPDVVPQGAREVVTVWQGHPRRECERVVWHRRYDRLEDHGWVRVRKSDSLGNWPETPISRYAFALDPGWMPGRYRICFVEEAQCNIIRSWTHDHGCAEFTIAGGGS